MKMNGKKLIKTIARFVTIVVITTALTMGFRIYLNGMWLLGIPVTKDVSYVTIQNTGISFFEEKILTDEEDIETCLHLTGFLRYQAFAKADDTDRPLVTMQFHLNNGNVVEVEASEHSVFFKGKQHSLKKERVFLTLLQGIFYNPELSSDELQTNEFYIEAAKRYIEAEEPGELGHILNWDAPAVQEWDELPPGIMFLDEEIVSEKYVTVTYQTEEDPILGPLELLLLPDGTVIGLAYRE